MHDLLTLEQAKRHLYIDDDEIGSSDGGSAHDPEILEKITEASALILDYLGDEAGGFLDSDGLVAVDSDGVPIIPASVRAAAKLMLGYLYTNRDENQQGAFEAGWLPAPVIACLRTHRTPTLA